MATPFSKTMLTSLTTAALAIPGIALAKQGDSSPKAVPQMQESQSNSQGAKPQSEGKIPQLSENQTNKAKDPKVVDKDSASKDEKNSKDNDKDTKAESDKTISQSPEGESNDTTGQNSDSKPDKKPFLSQDPNNGIKTDFKYTYFNEDGPRIKVNVWQALFVVPINNFEVRLNLERASQSGATQAGVVPEFVDNPLSPTPRNLISARTGSTWIEEQSEATLTTSYDAKHAKYSLTGFYSTEHDTTVPAIGAEGEWKFNKNNTILKTAISAAWENIKPAQDGLTVPIFRAPGKNSAQKYHVALKQDLSKYNYVQLSSEFQHFTGKLDDSYRAVAFNGNVSPFSTPGNFLVYPRGVLPPGAFPAGLSAAYEKVPGTRNVFLPILRFVQYVPWTKGSIHFDYRYAVDSWHINSNTFEFAYYQPLPKEWELEGRVRYYSQNRAYFYGPTFNVASGTPAFPAVPLNSPYYASDYRLSGYGTMSYEVKLSYQIFSKMKASVLGGYFIRKASYKMGTKDPIPNPETTGAGVGSQYVSVQFDFKF